MPADGRALPDFGTSDAVRAAQERLLEIRRSLGIETRGRVITNYELRITNEEGEPAPLPSFSPASLSSTQTIGDGRLSSFHSEPLSEHLRAAAARLGGSPVAVPVAELTGTIGRARAHLYAAFHSGRTQTDLLTGERRGRGPISRQTLCKLSGAATNSQRNYERRARVGRRKAIAIGPAVSAADAQETAWERGRALFRYHDRRGRHGRPGAVYLAWQLPNEYTGPHDTLPRGGQKRLNRSLADLFHDGMTGNGEGITNYELRITNSEVGGGQWAVASRSVGQCSVGQCSVVGGPSSFVVRRSSFDGGRWSAVGGRQYYNSARGAHGARQAGERYWRHGGVWLWQPTNELRITNYELRMKSGDDGRQKSTQGREDARGFADRGRRDSCRATTDDGRQETNDERQETNDERALHS